MSMGMQQRANDPNRLLVVGLMALVVANVGSYVIQRKLALPESIADPVIGFLYGVAIATMLLGIRLRARSLRDGAPRA
jgi:hypothetical protein